MERGLDAGLFKLRQLEIFRAVMQSGTVTGAATSLQMSQPAVTKAIRHMEDRLGFSLFDRQHGRVRPTPEAQRLHHEVDRIFRTVAIVERFAHDLRDAQSGVLSIACTPSLSFSLVADAVARFRAGRPEVRIWLEVTTTREVIQLAVERQIDFGVIYAPADEAGLVSTVLFDTELVCVVGAQHALARQAVVRPQHLQGTTVIMNVRNTALLALIEKALRSTTEATAIELGTNNTTTACALVRAGAGVAIVEPMSVKELFPDLVLKPFRPRIQISPRVVYSRDAPLSRLAKQFCAELGDKSDSRRRQHSGMRAG